MYDLLVVFKTHLEHYAEITNPKVFFKRSYSCTFSTKRDFLNITYFLILTCSAIHELSVSVHTKSLAVLISAVHTAFCLFSIIIYYAGKMYLHRPSSHTYSYGFSRVEPLLGFVNGFFLVLFSAYVLMQCVQRLLEPVDLAEMNSGSLDVIRSLCLGLLINTVGLIFFKDIVFVRNDTGASSQIPKSQIRFAFFHIIQNVSVIVLYVLSFYYPIKLTIRGVVAYDGLFACVMAVVVFYVAYPILVTNGMILLQTSPQNIYPQIYTKLQRLLQIDGVIEYENEHFWTLAPNVYMGSIVIKTTIDANDQMVLTQTHELFDGILEDICVQVQKK
ncbi:Cation transporter [Entamoeba marina]